MPKKGRCCIRPRALLRRCCCFCTLAATCAFLLPVEMTQKAVTLLSGHGGDPCEYEMQSLGGLSIEFAAHKHESDLRKIQLRCRVEDGGVYKYDARGVRSPCACKPNAHLGLATGQVNKWSDPVNCSSGAIGQRYAVGGTRRRHCAIDHAGRSNWDGDPAHYPNNSGCSFAPLPAELEALEPFRLSPVEDGTAEELHIMWGVGASRSRTVVDGCAPFAEGVDAMGWRDVGTGSGLPGGARCILEPPESAEVIPLSKYAAFIYKASGLPLLPSILSQLGSTKPRLDLSQRGVGPGRVGVMTMEPGSYYPLISEACRRHESVSLLLSPSLDATIPLPYFSWTEHPLNLPHEGPYRGPPDKVPGAISAPLANLPEKQVAFSTRHGALRVGGAVWIVSNCEAMNWRKQLVEYLMAYVKVDSIGKCMLNAPWPVHNICANKSSETPNWSASAVNPAAGGPYEQQYNSSLRDTPNACQGQDKIGDVLRRYRFYLATENTCEEGYVTEKVYNGLDAGCVVQCNIECGTEVRVVRVVNLTTRTVFSQDNSCLLRGAEY